MDISRVKNFVFDVDGTLIDTERTAMTSLHDTILSRMGRDVPHAELYKFFAMPSKAVASAVGCEDTAAFHEEWTARWIASRHLSRAFPGAEEMIRAASVLGGKIGIVTSRLRSEIEGDYCLSPLLHYFDVIISAEDTVRHKPDPEPMELFMHEAGIDDPRTCMYLGDASADCSCCHGAGALFGLADWGGRGMQGIPADSYFSTQTDFVDMCYELAQWRLIFVSSFEK